jgi:hypothetical protein
MTAIANVIKDRKVYLGGVDLSGDENEVVMTLEIDQKESTTFPDDCHTSTPGLAKVTLNQKGFLTFGEDMVDEALVNRLGTAGVPVSVTTLKGAVGEVAYFTKAWGANYTPKIAVGELSSFDFSMSQDAGDVVRGTILFAKGALAGGVHSSLSYNLGAVAEGSRVYAAVHVFDGTAAVAIKCGGAAEISFNAMTGPESGFKFHDGPIVGTSWSADVTVTGSATVVVVIGIV